MINQSASDGDFDEVAFGVGDDAFVVAVAGGARVVEDGDPFEPHALSELVYSLLAPGRYGYMAESAELSGGGSVRYPGLVHYLEPDAAVWESEEI